MYLCEVLKQQMLGHSLNLSMLNKRLHYAVINCIPAPHPGNSWVLAETYPEIYRILCPHRPSTYPELMGEIFPSEGADIYYLGMSALRGYGAGTYLGIYMKNFPRSPGQYQGQYLGCQKVQILIPGQVPTIHG